MTSVVVLFTYPACNVEYLDNERSYKNPTKEVIFLFYLNKTIKMLDKISSHKRFKVFAAIKHGYIVNK